MKVNLSGFHKLVNDIYIPAFKFTGRFLVLYGGSGSGKSVAIAQKILYRIMTEDNHNILCVRNTGNSLKKSCFALLKGLIIDMNLSKIFQINEADGKEKIIFKANGNQIIFSGLDDVEKLKSIYNVTSIWIEEASEVSPEDFRELNRRLRGYQGINKNGTKRYMQFMISFNPISQLHWLKQRFYDTNDKTYIHDTAALKNIKRVNTYDTLVIHSTYLDNRYIDDVYKKEMEELKKYDEYEYNIYALGNWGVVGHTYFNGEKVSNRITELLKDPKVLKQGYFEFKTYYNKNSNKVLIRDNSIKWIDDTNGYIKIYEDVKTGFPYVGGGDTAGEGSDSNILQVINNFSSTQVATLTIESDEDLFAKQSYCLGLYYNKALLGIETNFSTHPMKVLTELRYPNQYIREERPDSFTNKLSKIYGFNTNKATRPDMLGKLRTIVRDKVNQIMDIDTLNEMTTFIINEKGKPEAAAGSHDDRIMALAIAYYIQFQQRTSIKRQGREKTLIERDKERLAKQFKRSKYLKGIV